MPHDIVIRGGTVVDGTGAQSFAADVAIDGDTITEIGAIEADGGQEIDAAGAIVTPGFVDIHTHLDAQIGWDPLMTPVTWHGVTTALMGNCGVTFAPCKPQDREFLAGMMETVEDIPKAAILGGLPWNWESYGGYLDAIEGLKPAVNVAGMVGHCAVRFYVMGERSVEGQPTEEELHKMAEVAAQSVRDGAIGFSTSRYLGHFLPDGRRVPGTYAEHRELVEIAKAVGAEGGLMQGAMEFSKGVRNVMDLLAEEARAGSRVLFSAGAGPDGRFGKSLNQAVGEMRAQGLDVNAISIPRGGGFVSGLNSGFFIRRNSWKRLYELPFEQRLAAIRDKEKVAELVSEAEEVTKSRPADMRGVFELTFWMGDGDRPNYTSGAEASLQAMADAAGEHPAATWLRKMAETDGRGLFTYRMFNRNLDALRELLTTEWALPGLGDAGAHVGQVMDAGWATFVLSHWHRDTGVYSLPEAVRRITSAPARIIGVSDRGRLKPGLKADLNVIDLERLSERMPEYVRDFPNGGGRYIQRAVGYKATICNGRVIARDDGLTGARAGCVLRN